MIVTMPRVQYSLKLLLLCFSLTVTSLNANAQPGRVWSKIERLAPHEVSFFRAADAPLPDSIVRYYRQRADSSIENFENEAIYATDEAVIDGIWVYCVVRFRGSANDFSLTWDWSPGKAAFGSTTYMVNGTSKLLLERSEEITDNGDFETIKVTRNGILVATRRTRLPRR
jgi:hypothetical protein